MRVHGLDLKKDKALEEAKSGVLRDDMVAAQARHQARARVPVVHPSAVVAPGSEAYRLWRGCRPVQEGEAGLARAVGFWRYARPSALGVLSAARRAYEMGEPVLSSWLDPVAPVASSRGTTDGEGGRGAVATESVRTVDDHHKACESHPVQLCRRGTR